MKFTVDRSNGYIDFLFHDEADAQECADFNRKTAEHVRVGRETDWWRVRFTDGEDVLF